MSEPSGERTEQATPQRMKEVRSKGKLSRSQDITAWLGIGVAAVMIPSALSAGEDAAREQLGTVAAAVRDPSPGAALAALGEGLASLPATLGPMLAAVLVAVAAAAVLQGGVHPRKFKLGTEHLNAVSGFKRIFGLQALWQGTKALLKTVVIGVVLWQVVAGMVPFLVDSGLLPVSALLAVSADGVASLIQASVVAGLALAAVDMLVVARRNRKQTRMTRQEVKDENKKTDGDPLIRSQRRSKQLAMSRNRMIAAVADADVVLLNPTHVAVALRYQPGAAAPRVVAKGSGVVAARIREEAEAERVPMVRDIALARGVHAACELGQEIPVELFDGVARVLAFVMALKARGAAAGVHTVPPPRPPQRPPQRPPAPPSYSAPPNAPRALRPPHTEEPR